MLHEHEVGDGETPTSSDEADIIDRMPLPEHYWEMVCYLHQELYSTHARVIDDGFRVMMFRLCYDAARHLYEQMGGGKSLFDERMKISSGHVMALSLALPSISNLAAGASEKPHTSG